MINIENPDEIYEWDTAKLWNAVNMLDEEEIEEEDLEKIETIKNGYNTTIPIEWFTYDWIKLYPHHKTARVPHYGDYPLEDLMEEWKYRQKLMREIIIKYCKTEDPTIGR